MAEKNPLLLHERVDDVPALLGLMIMMNWPEIFDRHLGNHHLHQGLSHGWLIVIWLAYILSEGDHCKSHVQEWARQRCQTLEKLTGQMIRPGVEFNDDRLSIVLRRLSDPDCTANDRITPTAAPESAASESRPAPQSPTPPIPSPAPPTATIPTTRRTIFRRARSMPE